MPLIGKINPLEYPGFWRINMLNHYKSIAELHQLLRTRQLTCLKLVEQTYAYLAKTEPQIKAFLSINTEAASARAAQIDRLYEQGVDLPITAGIPIAVKDNICLKGSKTTCASKMLANFVPPYDATAIQKINENYLVPVGKTNLDEFAMGSSTENSAFQITTNPWDTTCVPGGSSGGSAAAVAAQQVPVALGSDTGGSIRQPAAFCGVVGLKPTYGRVSRYGLVAFASSLDQIGVFARSAEDTAHILQAICGYDPADATSAAVAVPNFKDSLYADVQGLKIGVPQELFGSNIDPAVKNKIVVALEIFQRQGAKWEETTLPSLSHAVSTYYILASAEASANLERYDGVRYGLRIPGQNIREMYTQTRGAGFGSEVKRRIILGTYVLSSGYYDAYYLKAQKARTLFKQDFAAAFAKYDVLITPTCPTTAFKIGQNTQNPLAMYLADIATIPVNLAGLPAISVPCGFIDGLPVGLQIIGRAFDEATLLKVAYTYQQLTSFHKQTAEVIK